MDANIFVATMASIGDECIGQLAGVEAGIFLDSAKGEKLDRLVFDRYGLVRKPASAAFGTAVFTTTVPSPVTFTIPSGVSLQTPSGVQFITTEDSVFPAGSVGPIFVAVRSVLAGANQNIRQGELTSITGIISGQAADLVVTNSLATSGADDAEEDDSLRDRGRKFFTTVRRGTVGAIEAAALSVPGVRKARAFEDVDPLGRPIRSVQLVVADAFAEQFAMYDTVPPRYQAQSQLLATTVFNSLAEVRPAGTYVRVSVANTILQPWQLALTFKAGADVNAAALQARAAIVTYNNSLAPGAPIIIKDAKDVLSRVGGLATNGANIISPAGNVQPAPLQVLRTSLGLVTALSSQTDQPITTGTNPDAFLK